MKYALVFILGIGIALAAGALLFKGQFAPTSLQNLVASPTPSPAEEATPTPTPIPKPTKKVSAGGILSFPKYELTVGTDWSVAKEVPGPDAEKVILKKGEYEISILEGAFGGAVCLFPGDPDFEGPSGRYDFYVDLTTKSGNLLRRVWTKEGGGFSVCEKTQYGWNAPSSFGHISILTPKTTSEEVVSEIDAILTSFTKL